MTNSSALEEALRIAELGIKILPCSQAKRPVLKDWPNNATTDREKITDWFSKDDFLVAALTGPETGLFVVDIDPKGVDWLVKNESRMFCERIHKTQRGNHFIYAYPESLEKVSTQTAGRINKGVDTRGKGGCLIWWPAHGYGSSGDLEHLTYPPDWIIALLTSNQRKAKKRLIQSSEPIKEGERNTALASYLGGLRAQGAQHEGLLEAAELFNEERIEVPLDPPEVAAVAQSISQYETKETTPNRETEDAHALKFVKHNRELRYVALWGKWMRWDSRLWVADDTLWVFDRIRKHMRLYVVDKEVFLNAGKVAAVERLVKSDRRYAATADQWDCDDHLLNTPDGTIDLGDGSLAIHNPQNYISKITTVAAGGEAPRWEQFLSEVTAGDAEYQSFLQRVAGYAASGFTHEHALFFLFGPGGNGKGLFLNTIQAILGNYSKVASMETFTESKLVYHPTDLAMLQGARMVFAQETESGRAWAESKIKSLTGGDPVTARFMRQDFFSFIPKFKLLISGNHLPKLKNVDEAMRRRLHLLPFTQVFKGKDRDPHLAEKLTSEHAGILQWIVDGAVAYQRDGLSPPPVVREASDAYFESEDLFKRWLNECCEQSAVLFAAPMKLFNSFKDFAEASNEVAGSYAEFRQRLESAGFTSGNSKAKNGRYWQGLSLRK